MCVLILWAFALQDEFFTFDFQCMCLHVYVCVCAKIVTRMPYISSHPFPQCFSAPIHEATVCNDGCKIHQHIHS